jgi:hypothetical protein
MGTVSRRGDGAERSGRKINCNDCVDFVVSGGCAAQHVVLALLVLASGRPKNRVLRGAGAARVMAPDACGGPRGHRCARRNLRFALQASLSFLLRRRA